MEYKESTGKAIVLVYGLTDSPYFLLAIAHHFYSNLWLLSLPHILFDGLTPIRSNQFLNAKS